LRAEEIILEIYKKKNELYGKGIMPSRIVITKKQLDILLRYKASLGELPDNSMDYITEDTLFGLPIFLDNVEQCTVL
jgi:hypothetical protein